MEIYIYLTLGLLSLACIYISYKIGFKNGKNSSFFIESINTYEIIGGYSFESGESRDKTILNIEKLLKEKNTYVLYYSIFKTILNGLRRNQKNNEIQTLTPKYIYDNFLFSIISQYDKFKLNFCTDCLKSKNISLMEDFKFFTEGLNLNLFDTKECSCCKKTTNVLNPLIYTVISELNLSDYFKEIDNKDKCFKTWQD